MNSINDVVKGNEKEDAMISKVYQMLRLDSEVPENVLPNLSGVVAIKVEGVVLLYVEPVSIRTTRLALADSEVRSVVLPDYVFAVLVGECTQLEINILGVEFPDGQASNSMRRAVQRFIDEKDSLSLSDFLRGAGATSLTFGYEQLEVKLFGSGLIRISSPDHVAKGQLVQLFKKLTRFLATFLDQSEPSARPTIGARIGFTETSEKPKASLLARISFLTDS